MTCAPQYMRVIAQQQEGTSPTSPGGRGCMAGNGFCFISHIGEVFGCGFLPISAGDIRQQKFKQIYQAISVVRSAAEIMNRLKENAASASIRRLCGGCRARALSIHKDYLEEEPYCIYKPKNLSDSELEQFKRV